MPDTRPTGRGGFLGQAWLVILLGLVYGAALAGVETTLGPIIAANRRQEIFRQVPALVSDADPSRTIEERVAGGDGREQWVYRAVASDGRQLGWVLPAGGQGFADRIELLIGLDRQAATITGLYVLDQRETPGLGNLIEEPAFRGQFAGKPTERPLEVVKGDPLAAHEIRAGSGATISSESVAEIVNRAMADFREPIRSLPASPPEP